MQSVYRLGPPEAAARPRHRVRAAVQAAAGGQASPTAWGLPTEAAGREAGLLRIALARLAATRHYWALRWALLLLLTIGFELALVVAGYQLYSTVRFLVAGERDAALQHGWLVLHLERTLHLSFEPGAQRLALHAGWLVRCFNYIYVFLYLPYIAVVAAVLFLRDRVWYRQARRTFLISGAIGLLVFARFPVAPPRLLDGAGFVDTIERFYPQAGYSANHFANQFAAVPSFHFGWTLLGSYCLRQVLTQRLLRALLMVIPALMFAAIVVTANHLWFDALAGTVVIAAAYRLARLSEAVVLGAGTKLLRADRSRSKAKQRALVSLRDQGTSYAEH